MVKVSQQQTSVRATSAGLQPIDILTSYISWHLPVMERYPTTTGHPRFFSVRAWLILIRNLSWRARGKRERLGQESQARPRPGKDTND